MATICPTITAYNLEEYNQQLKNIQGFSKRIHIDLADGDFAPSQTVNPIEIHWPDELLADIHVMHQKPEAHLETLIGMNPNLVVVHPEAKGNIRSVIDELNKFRIKVGIALLQDTKVSEIADMIENVSHVLIFSGNLGYQGGSKVDFALLEKVGQIKAIKDVEVGWDGGVNDQNIAQLADGGVNVINVGGYIQKTDDPRSAYAILEKTINR